VKIFEDRRPEMGDGDVELERVVNDLDHLGQICRSSTVPPQLDARVLQALRARATEQTPQQRHGWLARRLFAQPRSIGLIAVVVASLFAIAGVAYATVPALSRVFDMGAAHSVLSQSLGTRVNQSQTVAGYTMTVERAYADANRVLIAYTIRPPAGAQRQWNLTPDNLKVVTASGVQLPDRGYVVASDTGQPDATLQMFDAAGITDDPKEIHLRLTVPWIDGMEDLPASSPAGTGTGLPTAGAYGSIATDPANRPNGVQDPYVHDFRVFGPLSFNITVPFIPGDEVRPHQQVAAGGTTLTLERVVVSKTETRAYVRGLTPTQSHYIGAALSGDGWTDEKIDGGNEATWYSNGMTVFSYLGSFTDRHGAWTLTVKSLDSGVRTPAPAGTWTFHFTAP
jgi:hypothetical protein